MAGFYNKAALTFWSAVPMMVTLVLVMLYLVPKHAATFSNVMPMLHITAVFYWGMANYKHMPYWFVFCIGLLIDGVTGLPLGITSMIYVLFVLFMRLQRKYVHKEGFLVHWAFFSALLLVMFGIEWLVVTSLGSTAHALLPLLIQWLITVCFYPFASRIFDVLQAFVSSRRLMLLHTK
ncbi:MAG: rod shape-determining protein MreD [Alphaproteobacteria bacterium]